MWPSSLGVDSLLLIHITAVGSWKPLPPVVARLGHLASVGFALHDQLFPCGSRKYWRGWLHDRLVDLDSSAKALEMAGVLGTW